MIDMHNAAMTSEAMPLGNGLTVTFSLAAGRLDAAWSPAIPTGKKAQRYLAPYRRARDEFLRRVSLRFGLSVGVVEL